MQDRREFLRLAAGSAAASVLHAAPARKPNFLVILADDMGFSDARCYGGDIDTPNIDRLAAGGLRFTQAYSTARCGPSRSCLLTGQYAQQTASDVMTPGNIPNYVRFLPEYLRPLGYRSYHSGKWHMKHVTGEGGVGFDHSYTMLDELRFFSQNRHELDGVALPKTGPDYYSTTAIADYGVRFLKEHASEHAADPFFLYAAFHSPHFPLQAPQEDIDHYKDRFSEGWDTARERKGQRMRRMGLVSGSLAPLEPDMWTKWNTPDAELIAKIGPGEIARAVPWSTLTPEQKKLQRTKMAIHAAMITRMDTEIGKLLKQVEAMGALDDTVIIFLSDNGASSEQLIRGDGHDSSAPLGSAATHLGLGPGWASCSNAPFRLHKSWVNEGGIASPFIVHWPKGIKDRNQLRHDPCHFIDFLPTMVDLAGGKAVAPGGPGLAGRSLAADFAKDGSVPREYLYFNHNNNRAMRVGDWKLIATGASGPWELYNLAADRIEQKDLAAAQPDKVVQLSARWKQCDEEFVRVREQAPPSTKRLMPSGR
ncbi:MAG: arylsulfatase [Bryobacteraceae bacterium]